MTSPINEKRFYISACPILGGVLAGAVYGLHGEAGKNSASGKTARNVQKTYIY